MKKFEQLSRKIDVTCFQRLFGAGCLRVGSLPPAFVVLDVCKKESFHCCVLQGISRAV